jgi:antitoxin YefM
MYGFMYNEVVDAISYSLARATLAKAMDKVCEDHEPLIITRQGSPSVVLISLEDYESMDEAAYLHRSPANAKRLSDSIKRLNEGRAATIDVEDLHD